MQRRKSFFTTVCTLAIPRRCRISQYLGQDAPAEVRQVFFTESLGWGSGWLGHSPRSACCAPGGRSCGPIRRMRRRCRRRRATSACSPGRICPWPGATNFCRGVPLRRKKPRPPLRGHCVRAFEYGPERPPDLREMRLCRHKRPARGSRRSFPVGQFPADAPVLPEDAAASRGGRQAHAARARARRQYLAMLLPLLICEVTWSLGENVYTPRSTGAWARTPAGHDADRARCRGW